MPLPDNWRQAVMSAYGRQLEGNAVETGETSFWRRYGLPTTYWRRNILERVNDLVQGTQRMAEADMTGPLSDIYAGTAYADPMETGGPMETPEATVYFRGVFQIAGTGVGDVPAEYVYKSGVLHTSWSDSLESINDELEAWIGEMESEYEFGQALAPGAGFIVTDSIMVY